VKRALTACLTVAVASAAVLAHAQDDSTTRLTLTAGAAIPSGDLADGHKPGLSGAIALEHDLTPRLAVVVRGEYGMMPVDTEGILNEPFFAEFRDLGGSFEVEGGDFTVAEGSVNIKASLAERTSAAIPYVVAGGGVTRAAIDDTTVTATLQGVSASDTEPGTSETKPSASAGGGVEISLGGLKLVIEGLYHIVFTEEESLKHISVRGGLSFGL
jgi:hypothetical protein